MASGPVFQTAVRLELPVWVRRSIVKDDSLVETFHSSCVKVRKEEWVVGRGGGKGLSQPFQNLRVSRLSFSLALTIYTFHPLLFFSNARPPVSIIKEADVSENKDVSCVQEEEADQQAAADCLSSLSAASRKCLWSAEPLFLIHW